MTRPLRGVLLAVLLTNLVGLAADSRKSPLATLTEVHGKAEVLRGQNWEQVYPLQPLYAGDTLRVDPGGRATIMYLGASLETIGEAESPYAVTEKKAKSGQRSNVTKKIGIIMQRLVQGEEERTSVLTTRGPAYPGTEKLQVLQPDETSVLFGSGSVMLQWMGGQPPYHLIVFGLDKQGQETTVLENDARDTALSIPFSALVEDRYYRWQVTSGEQQRSGTFHVLSRAATASVQAELSGLLQRIPGENGVTQYLVEYGYLLDHALVYDANKILTEAKEKFPENGTFKNLSIY
jgi:hypothetical protein